MYSCYLEKKKKKDKFYASCFKFLKRRNIRREPLHLRKSPLSIWLGPEGLEGLVFWALLQTLCPPTRPQRGHQEVD